MILGVSFDDGNDFDGAVGETLRTLADDLVSTKTWSIQSELETKGEIEELGSFSTPERRKQRLVFLTKDN
jgi:hypothetical protein